MSVKGFYKLLQSYLLDPKMKVQGLDIWEIELKVDENGGLMKRVEEVENPKKKSKKLGKRAMTYEEQETDEKQFSKLWKRKLVNYASIGFGARVGLGFDQKRTKSRICNKLMYGWEGFKKMCFKGGGPTMQNLIEKFELIVEAKPNKEAIVAGSEQEVLNYRRMNSIEEMTQIGHWDVQSKTIFKSKKSQSSMLLTPQPQPQQSAQTPSKKFEKKTLLINPINLVMLNVNSYAGGIKNMWNKANPNTHQSSISGNTIDHHSSTNPFDSKLEFLSFKNRFYFGMCERACTGGGMRIAQGNPNKF